MTSNDVSRREIEDLESLAETVFSKPAKPTHSIALIPADGSDDFRNDEERSEAITSFLSIICTHGIKKLFGDSFHPQNKDQITELNDHLKAIGWRAIFRSRIDLIENKIVDISINFKPAEF